ncbi:DUF4252 domain-containing protein [Psychroflexus sp. CAK57W]|uniref:DUF4252 domain-containing protein n=1 Tax=Psychroflexus curvus TaxID=2873595 RepID=UPI001CCEDF99|nr:DUF4252 domain-containing protein [Psychroflexus curvus]MBZ9626527.1 DUF4252 domain-containing protein [Psychroflexus curvus]MBZ9786294.1 DUF4252 domain-containing protein [Psychroflexus curvus]
MKQIKLMGLIMTIALLSATATNAQDFSKYDNVREITSIVVNKGMFRLMSKLDLDSSDKDVKAYLDLVENLDDIKIYTTESLEYGKQLQSDFNTLKSKSNLEELMRVNSEGKTVNFYIKPGKSDDFVNQLLMFVNSSEATDTQSVLMVINGNIDLKNISKLTSQMNIPGGKSLDKLKDQ